MDFDFHAPETVFRKKKVPIIKAIIPSLVTWMTSRIVEWRYSKNQRMGKMGGLGFDSGYPAVTPPFIFGDPRNLNHQFSGVMMLPTQTNALLWGKSLKDYHRFALFDPPSKMGHLMTPDLPFAEQVRGTKKKQRTSEIHLPGKDTWSRESFFHFPSLLGNQSNWLSNVWTKQKKVHSIFS